ncbi:MAG: pyruvate kinase [Alphaproteobacteria bacterium]|jgi:pyruvate kinase|nr:pyruvate kinase [Alphaproteobacteria bacterium]
MTDRQDRPAIRRTRQSKIVATLGPATSEPAMIRALLVAGVDVFRLNFSHGTQAEHAERIRAIRALEAEYRRPIAIIADLQGPKLRIGTFADGTVRLTEGRPFRLDTDPTPGTEARVPLPHPEVFASLTPGETLLLNDGAIRLRVEDCGPDFAETRVEVGGPLSDRKGLNLPDTELAMSALTDKDRGDLRFAVEHKVDWIALSFVQRPQDVADARRLIAGRAHIIIKLEKPSAVHYLTELLDMTDAVMVARGDLGVEMQAEDVPGLQKRIIQESRKSGKPVIVATQMLESMIASPTPTRAEASDVATAVFDGADAVMLSAETAIGQYPVEAVTMMDRIARRVQRDPLYRTILDGVGTEPDKTAADAITAAARQVASTVSAAAIVTYTTSGSTTLRAARERPEVPIICLTPEQRTARRLALCWGVHPAFRADEIRDFDGMVATACAIAQSEGIAEPAQRIVITAGLPFGTPGSTNVLRIAWVGG